MNIEIPVSVVPVVPVVTVVLVVTEVTVVTVVILVWVGHIKNGSPNLYIGVVCFFELWPG